MTDSGVAVAEPAGGWPPPWLRLVEIAEHLPVDSWMLVGGLMTQAHTMAAGIIPTRPSHDVDLIIKIGAGHNHVAGVVTGLKELGYQVLESLSRHGPTHRLLRGRSDQVDIAVADHLPPATVARVARRDVFRIPGGTQAAQRAVPLRIAGCTAIGTIPSQLGALVLKGAAFVADSRDADRHLTDAAALAATIADPTGLSAQLKGSDRKRIATLRRQLDDPMHPAWFLLPERLRVDAHRTLMRLGDPQLPADAGLQDAIRVHAQTFPSTPTASGTAAPSAPPPRLLGSQRQQRRPPAL